MDTNEPSEQEQESLVPHYATESENVLPPEDLNPWASIIYRPRDTIRYVLDTGAWNNIWVLYAIVFVGMFPSVVLGMLAQPESPQMGGLPGGISEGVIYGIFLLGYALLGYPFGMLMLYLIGWLYRVVGSWLGGDAVASDMRIAVTWAYVFSMYTSIVMLIPNGMFAFYYRTAGVPEPSLQIMLLLLQFAVSAPLLICNFVVASKAVGEAHRYSAWHGFGTIFITFLIMTAVMMVPFFILFGILIVLAIM